MSGVRRGVAGVRLCDQPGCHHPWPCYRCGARRLGARIPEAAVSKLRNDVISCIGCGYQKCSCRKSPTFKRELLGRWELVGETKEPMQPARQAGNMLHYLQAPIDQARNWATGWARPKPPTAYAAYEYMRTNGVADEDADR